MKERKNILLFLGMILSVFPLCVHIYKLAIYLVEVPKDILLLLSGNVALYMFVIFLAAVQLIRNRRNISSWILAVIGIAVSAVCLVLSILSILSGLPQFLVHNKLGLVDIGYVINQLLVVFGLPNIIGHILLLLGYVWSFPKRKQEYA